MKTTTANKVIDYLQITSQEHEEMVFKTFQQWATKFARNDYEFQRILTSTGIDKWFMHEYTRLEQLFCNIIENNPVNNGVDYVYHGCTVEIFQIYPNPLLNFALNIDFRIQLHLPDIKTEHTAIYAN